MVRQSHVDSNPSEARLSAGTVETGVLVFTIIFIAGKLQFSPTSGSTFGLTLVVPHYVCTLL